MKTIQLILLSCCLGAAIQNLSSQNVLISNSGNPNEPSIMMDPTNTDVLVAGSNLNFCYTSNDGGQTWVTKTLTSTYGVWGDPVIDIDTQGNFYFFHLSNTGGSWIDRIVCQKSTDNGANWSSGTFTGLNGSKNQDKHWSVIDRYNNNIYLTWTQFDSYGSSNVTHRTNILFSKSTDGGDTWSATKQINTSSGNCIDGDDALGGAVPAVGSNGEIYVTWAGPNGISFNKSTDQGATWLNQEILIDPMPTGWDYKIPGLDRSNGLPVLKCDLSGGANHGTLYVNWTDQRNGANDTDVWISKSVDGGNTWSTASKVNNDAPGKHQFFTWMDIDQTNGNIYAVFYDRRNYTDSQTDVYLAFSGDGGNTFENKKISESPFTPSEGIFFGDYTNIVAHNDIVRPIWTRLNGGQLSIWTNITPINDILSIPDTIITDNTITHYPNPSTNNSYISFKLHKLATIKLELYDATGKFISSVIDNKKMNYGKYIIPINRNYLNLSSGTYYYKLFIDDKSKTLKSIILD